MKREYLIINLDYANNPALTQKQSPNW
jgi:hypothetical protein